MPFSWIRVPNHESQRVRDELGKEDYSRDEFVEAVSVIVGAEGGSDVRVYYELNGKWVRIAFSWDDYEVKKRVTFALAGEDAVDFLTVEEANKLGR